MKEILRFLNSHGSCRRFTDEPITEEHEHTIVTTGQRSPTSSNLQAYSIFGIRDAEKKALLAELCGNQSHIEQAPLFLVFCADLHRLHRECEKKGYPSNVGDTELFIVATVDAALVACRALMAAQAMGLGGVMVGGIRNNPQQICNLLRIPKLVTPIMGMSLGHPEKQPAIKPRLPEEGVYFREQYAPEQVDPAVNEYDATINAVGYLKGRETEPDKYRDFAGTYSWTEHSARRLATQSERARRLHMLTFLRNQGFLQE